MPLHSVKSTDKNKCPDCSSLDILFSRRVIEVTNLYYTPTGVPLGKTPFNEADIVEEEWWIECSSCSEVNKVSHYCELPFSYE